MAGLPVPTCPAADPTVMPYNCAVNEDGGVPSISVGELEASVLTALWERGELPTPEVFSVVGQPRGLAYTTILTVLQRLHRKGLVSRRGEGKAHVYSPAMTREEFARRRGEFLAGAMVKLGSAGLSAFLAEADRLDPAFLVQIRRHLDEAEP